MYRKEGLLDDAICICREGLTSNPESPAPRFVLGQFLRDRGARKEAREEFHRILERDPANKKARRELEALNAEGDSGGVLTGFVSLPEGQHGEGPDPLASPTLAALLAFQGQAAAAEGLFRQLGGTEQEPSEKLVRGDRLLAALLAFRDAARRLRSMRGSDE